MSAKDAAVLSIRESSTGAHAGAAGSSLKTVLSTLVVAGLASVIIAPSVYCSYNSCVPSRHEAAPAAVATPVVRTYHVVRGGRHEDVNTRGIRTDRPLPRDAYHFSAS